MMREEMTMDVQESSDHLSRDVQSVFKGVRG
jgi:hypothetical protein